MIVPCWSSLYIMYAMGVVGSLGFKGEAQNLVTVKHSGSSCFRGSTTIFPTPYWLNIYTPLQTGIIQHLHSFSLSLPMDL
ncbi:hypothetical protein BDF14DRAFT_1760452 [Spinellus fusiger]|nr:hypothetical protein BDF14DRAFT_1760452 [Spinellus fusiger]